MKFEEVLPALKAGKKIRRKDWLSDGYIKMSSLRYFGEIVDEYDNEYGLTIADLTKDDWENIDEKKIVKLRNLTEEQLDKWNRHNMCSTCEGCIFENVYCHCDEEGCWIFHKDMFSDKFLDQEIEIDEPILTDEEREYLRAVIKPFRDNVKTIEKFGSEYLDSDNDFVVIHLVEDSISLPILNTSFKFNGMELNKQYTVKELRL